MAETPPREETVWEGSPSHWIRAGTYFLSILVAAGLVAGFVVMRFFPPASLGAWAGLLGWVLLGALVIPLFLVVRAFVAVRGVRYRLTSERIISTTGLLSRTTENLELYRVDDLKVLQPLFLRMVGRGTLSVAASDRSDPVLLIEAVPDAHALLDTMRRHVEECRDRKRTRVLDMGSD